MRKKQIANRKGGWSLSNYLLWFCWIVFIIMIGVFILFAWRKTTINNNIQVIRKLFFLLVFGGALVYWSMDPDVLFTDWRHYVIILGIYLVIDIFFLLGYTITKFGAAKVEPYAKTIEENAKVTFALRKKTKSAFQTVDGVKTLFFNTELEYLGGLRDFLNGYARTQQFVITIFPFDDGKDKDEFYSVFNRRERNQVIEQLRDDGVFFSEKGDRAFREFSLFGHKYILDIDAEAEGAYVEEADIFLLDTLILVHDMNAQKLLGRGESDGR